MPGTDPTLAAQETIYDTLQVDPTLRTSGPNGFPLLHRDMTGQLPSPLQQGPTLPLNTVLYNGQMVPAMAIFPAMAHSDAPPYYPCVTYRVSDETPEKSLEGPAGQPSDSPVSNLAVEFEIWAGTGPNQKLVLAVLGVLKSYFKNTAFSIAPDLYVFASEWQMGQSNLSAPVGQGAGAGKVYFGLARARLRVQQGIGGAVPLASLAPVAADADASGPIRIAASGPIARPAGLAATFLLDTSSGALDCSLWNSAQSVGGAFRFTNVGNDNATLTLPGQDIFFGYGNPLMVDLQPAETVTLAIDRAGYWSLLNPTMTILQSTQTVTSREWTPTTTSASTPITAPGSLVISDVIERTLTANLTDYLYSANQGHEITTVLSNDDASTAGAIYTVNSVSGETFQTLDGGTALTSVSMKPGEARTFVNKSSTVWEEV